MPIISATPPVPPNLLQRAAAIKKTIPPSRISPTFGPQTVPATSLWYEANTLYFVGSNTFQPYPVAFASLAAFASYASSVVSGSAIPASLYPAPYSPQTLPGQGWCEANPGFYQLCFACNPGLAGVCVPAVQAVAPTWIKWSIESTYGINGISLPSFSMPSGFGPLCRGLTSIVQTLCSSGLTSVAIAYVLLGPPPNPNGLSAGVLRSL